MCGRFASFTDAQDLADELAIAEIAEDARLLPPSWNVAPTDPVRIVLERARKDSGEVRRSMELARWGLVPSWAKDPTVGARMINARSETLLDKPAFAKPFAARRCLVLADGYYEWRKLALPASGSKKVPKQPYWIHPAGPGVAAFAGLYEFWRNPAASESDPDRWLVSTTVVTRPAAGRMEAIHDRMPLLLPPEAWDTWLDPAVGDASDLLRVDNVPLATLPVGDAVGSVQNDGPSLIEVDPEPRDPEPVAL
ncbi:putative SOS response-associated peptidase YedK [Promicromonospora sp. AC04]|uniref:SOS response-associated peptidase n=1 Tax=Promicromonospora sp. AC04 TaxID=2135723 RepID=UPI000D33A887|nr:SOS response-associated peptidase [Promicromonospora sp. AC04]PUB32328.1 putative SOS response-associated peptidase YedK [Promicromonospora sp. AC04]